MGSGSAGLLWYVLCCASVGFITTIGLGLFWWGERRKRQKRARRAAALPPGDREAP